jgi:hypothetical protein
MAKRINLYTYYARVSGHTNRNHDRTSELIPNSNPSKVTDCNVRAFMVFIADTDITSRKMISPAVVSSYTHLALCMPNLLP